MNIYITTGNITDMQGPCPTGFHVPLSDEFGAVKNAMTTLGIDTSNGNCCKTYLKMPFSGVIGGNGTRNNVGTLGLYSLNDTSNDFVDRSYNVYIASFLFSTISTTQKISARPIRPFKDTPITPDNTWTTLYGTLSAGIFHNTTEGLISISSNGTKRITIADKNLGATTVYNDGDTLSESNCGGYFQRGNNYMFPFTGTLTTSSTKVNASTYGPGNYYSSSTYITANASPYNWDSSDNNNLRGGVTGPISMEEVKNIYIGEAPYDGDELCFTANTAGSTVKLTQKGSPTAVSLETSTDGENWNTYTIGSTITLSNIGDKVYWRNKSTTNTGFSGPAYKNYYNFVMTGSIAASGDINYLINKNSTTTLSGDYIFERLFFQCEGLTSTPRLPATTLSYGCYRSMFGYCYNLETLPSLPATTLTQSCYGQMVANCSKIKLSSSKTGDYQTVYRIPTTGTGTDASSSMTSMFYNTGGTFTGTPSINTTYYTSNTVV